MSQKNDMMIADKNAVFRLVRVLPQSVLLCLGCSV